MAINLKHELQQFLCSVVDCLFDCIHSGHRRQPNLFTTTPTHMGHLCFAHDLPVFPQVLIHMLLHHKVAPTACITLTSTHSPLLSSPPLRSKQYKASVWLGHVI
jgi:hypothetical protein